MHDLTNGARRPEPWQGAHVGHAASAEALRDRVEWQDSQVLGNRAGAPFRLIAGSKTVAV